MKKMKTICFSSSNISFVYEEEEYNWNIATSMPDEDQLEPMLNAFLKLCTEYNVRPELKDFCNCVNKLGGCIALPVEFLEKLAEKKLALRIDGTKAHLN